MASVRVVDSGGVRRRVTLLRQLTRRSWSWRSMCARNAATRSPPLSTTATIRPDHTVRRDVNPLFWRLIDGFRRRTGVPGVLNTSFNVKGEAIVCSPTDAVRCFYGTGLDALAIGSFLVEKTSADNDELTAAADVVSAHTERGDATRRG